MENGKPKKEDKETGNLIAELSQLQENELYHLQSEFESYELLYPIDQV